MIRYQGVWKSFGAQVVLRGVDLEIKPGEIFFILGRTGAGKTVLIRLLVGLLKPDKGEVWLDKERVDVMDEEKLRQLRRKCGMIFQFPTLFDSLSVFENIAFGLRRHYQFSESEIKSRVEELLGLVHLEKKILNRFPSQLSYGMQKRVSLARAIALEPRYLLYDEPTTGLDPFTARQINLLILELREKLGVTSIVVSHDLESMKQVADRVGVLEAGRFLTITTPKGLGQSEDNFIRRFLEVS